MIKITLLYLKYNMNDLLINKIFSKEYNKVVNKVFNNVFIYIRVSTNKQKSGLDYQLMLCENYANKELKINDFKVYDDYGSNYKKQKYLYNFNKLKRNIDNNSLILISEVSRLGRNIHQVFDFLKYIKKKNSQIYSVSENLYFNENSRMDKKFYKKVIESETESDNLSERMKNKYLYIKNNGGYFGRVPYGKLIKKIKGIPILINNTEEIKIINKILKLYNNNNTKIYKNIITKNECYLRILEKLNQKNILKREKLWTLNGIKLIIKKFSNKLTNPIKMLKK